MGKKLDPDSTRSERLFKLYDLLRVRKYSTTELQEKLNCSKQTIRSMIDAINASSETVVIEEGVTAVGKSMFMSCKKLGSIELPDTITTIGSGAFYACSSLESIQLPGHITVLEDNTFSDCSNLKSIMLPAGVKSIGYAAFSDCTGLQSAGFPETLENIGENAFKGCTGISSITIPKNVSAIGNLAFSGCSSLESIIFQCPAPPVITDAIAAFSGTAYYPANDEFWDEETRTAWAPDATWVAEGNVDVTVVASGECGEHATWELTNQGILYVRGTGQMADYDPNTVSPFYEPSGELEKRLNQGSFAMPEHII